MQMIYVHTTTNFFQELRQSGSTSVVHTNSAELKSDFRECSFRNVWPDDFGILKFSLQRNTVQILLEHSQGMKSEIVIPLIPVGVFPEIGIPALF